MDFLSIIAHASSASKRYVEAKINHQRDVIQIMAVLPGKYRYAQVDAAINASGVRPEDISMSLAANEHTMALARFYEALGTNSEEKL